MLDEANETFFLNLAGPTNATLADSQGLGTINDNDPTPTLSVDDVTVLEGNTGTVNAIFTVTLSAPSGRTVTVDYATANDTAVAPGDYLATSGGLTFNPGETTRTVTVTVNGDLLNEVTETLLPEPDERDERRRSPTARRSARSPTTTARPRSPSPTRSSRRATRPVRTSRVSLSAPSGQSVTVDYATANGSATSPADYTGGQRNAHLQPGPDLDADQRAGHQRPARRDRRDVPRQPHERRSTR